MAIARALVFEPEVLLLDEPLSNLDARLRAQMGDEFRALQRRLKITTLYVTHDQEEAMALSDRVVVMQQGPILQVGAPEIVYRRPASRDVAAFFGTPNFIEAKVTACRPTADDDHLLTIEGAAARGDCRAGEAFRPGDAVLVMIRPEDVTLARRRGAASSPGPARWSTASSAGRGARSPSRVGPALQRRMPGDARGGGRRNGDADRRGRQCLGPEALTGAAGAIAGRQMRRSARRAATGRISSRPSRAGCG